MRFTDSAHARAGHAGLLLTSLNGGRPQRGARVRACKLRMFDAAASCERFATLHTKQESGAPRRRPAAHRARCACRPQRGRAASPSLCPPWSRKTGKARRPRAVSTPAPAPASAQPPRTRSAVTTAPALDIWTRARARACAYARAPDAEREGAGGVHDHGAAGHRRIKAAGRQQVAAVKNPEALRRARQAREERRLGARPHRRVDCAQRGGGARQKGVCVVLSAPACKVVCAR